MKRLIRICTTMLIVTAGSIPISAHALLMGTLEVLSPISQDFVLDIDFRTFSDNGFAVTGDVTSWVYGVDIGSGSSGCEAADFAGFIPASIALVERGACAFSTKAINAYDAGALGILIFDNSNQFPGNLMSSQTAIPALFLTDTLGAYLLSFPVLEMRMTVTRVSEPGMLVLVFGALGGLAIIRRRVAR